MITPQQSQQLARMMLQAATYHKTWIVLYPIVTRREGRSEIYSSIAKALSQLLELSEEMLIAKLEWSNAHNDIHLQLPEAMIERLRLEWHSAPIYIDEKKRRYVMWNGVYTQDLCYQVIDVDRYVNFTFTGKYQNIDSLKTRLSRQSAQLEREALEAFKIL